MNTVSFKDKVFNTSNVPLKSWLESNQHIGLGLSEDSFPPLLNYKALWEIDDGKLYLIQIESNEYRVNHLFPDVQEGQCVFADWFTGNIDIGVGESKSGWFNSYYDNYIRFSFIEGVLTDRQVLSFFYESPKFDFGQYDGCKVEEVILGKVSVSNSRAIYHYLNRLLEYLTNPKCEFSIWSPALNILNLEKLEGTSFRDCGIRYFLTNRIIALDDDDAYGIFLGGSESASVVLVRNLLRFLEADFKYLLKLVRSGTDYEPSEESILLNPAVSYVEWAIKNVKTFSVRPDFLQREFKLTWLKTFRAVKIDDTVIQYTPIFEEVLYRFSEELWQLNKEKFERQHSIIYEEGEGLLKSSKTHSELIKDYGFYLEDDYSDGTLSTLSNDYSWGDDDGGYGWDEGGGRYEKYGGYNGFDDDAIDSAFEGDPENTWNVD